MLWLAFVRALPQTPRLSGGDACAAGGKETFHTSLHALFPGKTFPQTFPEPHPARKGLIASPSALPGLYGQCS